MVSGRKCSVMRLVSMIVVIRRVVLIGWRMKRWDGFIEWFVCYWVVGVVVCDVLCWCLL